VEKSLKLVFLAKNEGSFSPKGVNYAIKARKDVDFRLYRAFGVEKSLKLVFLAKNEGSFSPKGVNYAMKARKNVDFR